MSGSVVSRRAHGVPVAFRSVRFLVFAVAIVLVVLPFVSVVSTSLSDQETLNRAGGFVLWTNSPTLDSYRQVFDGGIVTRALLVSATVTAVGTAISVSATIGLAFGLSRPKSPGSKPILMMVLFTLLFSPGLIPSYLMVKQLGLIDSYWALILPVAVNAFNVIVVRSFFMDLPQELIDSARIDGATEWKILTRITLPLSRAAIAVVSLFYGVGYWNAFFNAMLYLNDAAKWPLQLVLRQYAINGNAFDPAGSQGFVPPPQQAMQMAVLVVSIVPVIVVYPFLQKHFAKGMLTGAVKG